MERYYFKGLGGADSVCGVQHSGNTVLLTELHDNPGTSVTNACVLLASELAERFNIKPEELRVIERYPESRTEYSVANLQPDPHWFCGKQVAFRCPSYSPLTAEQAQNLIPH